MTRGCATAAAALGNGLTPTYAYREDAMAGTRDNGLGKGDKYI